MKRLISCAIAALIATTIAASAAPDTAAIQANEQAAWQAFKGKKADEFKKVVDHDMVAVYSDGIADMAKELADMQKWDMKSFTISDFKAHSDEKDVVVTSYTVKVEGTFDGNDASGTYYAGTVWKQENGQWLAIFHTDAKAESRDADSAKEE